MSDADLVVPDLRGQGTGAMDVPGYAATLTGEADRTETGPGQPRWDDDSYADKLDLLSAERVDVVSFTFGCPSVAEVQRLHKVGSAIWVTVTTPDEAAAAHAVGADAVIVQGVEAGGHRGSSVDVTAARTAMTRAVSNLIDGLDYENATLDEELPEMSRYLHGSSDGGHEATELQDQLHELSAVLDTRMIIEQAKGFLMARGNISAEQAFQLLRAQSQHTNVKLREVAAKIIASTAATTDQTLRPPRIPKPRQQQG